MKKQTVRTQSEKEKYIKKAMRDFIKIEKEIEPFIPKKGTPATSTTDRWTISSLINNN
ncbi:unnamed protein product [marine sediment metagenome]|uniref:Uncharacterized protein n=1 Tax=marine sediment metagenome TaxID=412755 RepID=X1B6E4_9ZZZZ